MNNFLVHEELLFGSSKICDLELSTLLIKYDKDNPWFVLVPRKNNLVELMDLSHEDQNLLMEEATLVSQFLKEYYRPYKINIATFGNIVRQFHLHVIARYENDRAWPNSIFGTHYQNKFEEDEILNIKSNFLDFID